MYNNRHTVMVENRVLLQPISMGQYDIILNGKTISYTLKRSQKAKLIWLDIKRKSGLTVTIPYRYNIRNLPDFLNHHAAWILKNLAKYCVDNSSPALVGSRPSDTISYLGKCLKITQNRNGHGSNMVKLEQNKLVISLCSSGNQMSSGELTQWLRNQAVKLINDKVKKFSQLIGVAYNRVAVRDQRSRWGSCSCRRNLNFNWRLIMAPEQVLDYVIIHEICHLIEMSHSKKFWELVARYCPQWHEHRDWLDNHSLELNAQLQFSFPQT